MLLKRSRGNSNRIKILKTKRHFSGSIIDFSEASNLKDRLVTIAEGIKVIKKILCPG